MTTRATFADKLGDGTIFLNPENMGYDEFLMKVEEAWEGEPQTVSISPESRGTLGGSRILDSPFRPDRTSISSFLCGINRSIFCSNRSLRFV